jgi:hypothetical protein
MRGMPKEVNFSDDEPFSMSFRDGSLEDDGFDDLPMSL